jgi:hypothetical protein
MSQEVATGAPEYAGELSTAIQNLTQATQLLTAAAAQMTRTMQSMPPSTPTSQPNLGGSGSAAATINTLEDDPFSEATPTANPSNATPLVVNVPVNNAPLLQTRILDPEPPPGRFALGTAQFRYWTAREALTRGVNFWSPILPIGTRWSAAASPLQVTLIAGQTLNANYTRLFGLRFYQQTVKNIPISSAESPDVVCHELGHAILDALRPQLFNAANTESDAFHESFGDMSSILSALQVPSLRQRLLAETGGKLNVNSRLSRLAEQLGWGIRQLSPTAVDADSLRNAANRFFYTPPAQLPTTAPATQLSAESHSFSRVFTGAFLDALARMVDVLGGSSDTNLLTISRDLGQLLVDGIRTAPVVPAYFGQVAANMLQADQVRNNGRYRKALSSAFIQHGILAPNAITKLTAGPLPRPVSVAIPIADITGITGYTDYNEISARRTQTLLAYDDEIDESFRLNAEEAEELPTRPINTKFGLRLIVHAPDERELFAIAPVAFDSGSVQLPEPEEAALHYVEDLIQLGRIEISSISGISPEVNPMFGENAHMLTEFGVLSGDGGRNKTHVLVNTPDGLTLKRIQFDCGFHCRH